MSWQPVIGLEIHAQLLTASKIFSAADNTYGGAPNSKACPVDLGLPGVLPVLNENAVKMAIKFGLAIGAKINQESIDCKNYFIQICQKATRLVSLKSLLWARAK